MSFPLFMNTEFASDKVMSGTATVVTNAVSLKQIKTAAVQIVWLGTAEGSFKIQATCDQYNTDNNTFTPTNWADIAGSEVTLTGANGGSIVWNLSDLGYSGIRLSYTNTSSSGTFDARINGKGI